jgi:hypothetical protein
VRDGAAWRRAARAAVAILPAATAACGARSDLAASGGAPPPDLVCKGSPAEPVKLQSIGSFKSFDRATSITAAGAFVYYEVNDGSNEALAIYETKATGGKATPIVLGVPGCASSPFGFGDLVTDGRYLYTPDEVEVDLCSGASLDVTAYDLATGALTMLPNPPSPTMRGLASVRAAPGGGAIWIYTDDMLGDDSWIVRWDGTSTSVIAQVPDLAFDLVISGDQALVAADKSLYLVALSSGEVTSVGSIEFGKFSLAGANATAFFYTPDGVSIDRRDAATGEVTTVVAGTGSQILSSAALWVDDDSVYFPMGSPTSGGAKLGRVPATGGEATVIYEDAKRDGIDAVTSDGCNVYWVAGIDFDHSRPSALYARGR